MNTVVRRVELCLLMLLIMCSAAMAGTVYFNDFEGTAGSEWSTTSTATTPAGCTTCTTFLGGFVNDTVVLTLSGLTPGVHVSISFDLFAIRSWDGNGENGWGPDTWTITLGDGASYAYTFANGGGNTQSYPVANSSPGTGAIAENTLGYSFGTEQRDSVYHLTYSWYNPSDTATITFSASGLQGLSGFGYADELWGLDNVQMTANPEPSTAILLGSGVLAFILYRRRKRA